jgi:formate dehydrogenase subunit gamma
MSEGVLRFTVTERALHWAFAAGYLLLLASGLPLMLPVLRGWIRGYSLLIGVRLHLACAIFWVLATLGVLALGDRRRVGSTLGQMKRLERSDYRWLRRFPRWLVATPPERARLDRAVGRFNAGQKINTIFTLLTASLLLITGLALWPFGADGLWRDAHRWLTVLVLMPIAGHIFLAAVHPSTRHALTGMLDGRVDREWAATHHPRWEPK